MFDVIKFKPTLHQTLNLSCESAGIDSCVDAHFAPGRDPISHHQHIGGYKNGIFSSFPGLSGMWSCCPGHFKFVLLTAPHLLQIQKTASVRPTHVNYYSPYTDYPPKYPSNSQRRSQWLPFPSLLFPLKTQTNTITTYHIVIVLSNQLIMNRRQPKIEIIPPFEEITNNWELVHEIESSLNQYLSHPLISPPSQDDSERLGKSGIEQLVIVAKQLLHFVEILRSEHKSIESIKANASVAQEKLEQHEEIVRNYEKKFSQRTKAMVEENRVLKETNDKIKRSFVESEQSLRINLNEAKTELTSLRQDISKLENEKKNLLEVISNLQQEFALKEETINQLQKVTSDSLSVKTMKLKMEELMQLRIQKKIKPSYVPKQVDFNDHPPLEKVGLKDISALSQLLSYLKPSEILLVAATNKSMRLLCQTHICTQSLCMSIISIKDKRIGYFQKHISYFQKMREKIPSQILKTAYFRYHILKESAGQQIKQALNASSLIFEGRFEGQQLYTGLPEFNKEIPLKLDFKSATILEINSSIIQKFKDIRNQERDQLIRQFEEMYLKIKNTYDLYRADEESSTLFISNILKHFSKVFVMAKSIYFEVQHLQNLNSFILLELNRWDRMQIDKTLQLQDLRAELQAEKKLKLFFTDKSIKSQQKALLQQNLKLTYQMKFNKLNDLMNSTCFEKDEISRRNDLISKSNQKLSAESKQLRRVYEIIREKYNHVIEELVVVKETIIKMNII